MVWLLYCGTARPSDREPRGPASRGSLLAAVAVGVGIDRIAGIALQARDGAEVSVDRQEVVLGPIAVHRPGHHLEERAVERCRDAMAVRRSGAGGMPAVQVSAVAHNLDELLEGMALGLAILV